ncbi:40S ribosomal protein S10 [Sarcoptes scabiei]|nr:40S ribosomal protein S10 [Sarcoptes scabiei]
MIKSILIMNLDPNIRLVRFLEDELIHKIEFSYDIRLLLSAFNLYHRISGDNPKRKLILEKIIKAIDKKLDNSDIEISELIAMIKYCSFYTPDIMIKIEDQLIRYLDSDEVISLDNLCFLLVLLSRYNRRNINLIRSAVSKVLSFRSEDIYMIPPHLINMISSLKRLNFPEINLLEKCSDILVDFRFIETLNKSSFRDFIVAITNFNFSYTKLNDYLLKSLAEKSELFEHQDLVTLVLTFSRLNYHRDDLQDLLMQRVIPKVKQENCSSSSQWFNYVNSLILLRSAPIDHVRSILRSSFYYNLDHESMINPKQISRKMISTKTESENEPSISVDSDSPSFEETEIEQINAFNERLDSSYAKMNILRKYCLIAGLLMYQAEKRIIQSDSTPLLFENFFDSSQEMETFQDFTRTFDKNSLKRSKDVLEFRKKLILSLEKFVPSKNNYMAVNVQTPFGFFIDIELMVDQNGQFQVLQESTSESEKNRNYRRVVLMPIGFNETLLENNTSLIGPKQAEISLLRSLGYIVVPIHQNSFQSSISSLNRVKFLQDLIASHLKNSTINDE